MKKIYIDIESLNKGDYRKGNKPVEIITYWCDGMYKVFLWQQPTRIPPVYEGDVVIPYVCENEREMFARFFEEFLRDDPDLILAWNVDYDMSYIISRAKRLGLDPNRLSPFGQAYVSKDGARIKGRLLGDLLAIYKHTRSQYASNALADVVAEEFDIEKDERYEEAKDDPDVLVELNLQHVWLHKLVDEKFGLADYYIGIYHTTGYNPFEMFTSHQFINYFLLTVREEGEYLPTGHKNVKRKPYRAAIVLDPLPGLHKAVANIDFSRMYPSIILAFNISPDTIVPYGEGDINYRGDGFEVGFRTDKLGLLPRAIKKAYKLRDDIDMEIANCTDRDILEVLKKKKQAIKGSLINCFYGVFAFEKFKLFNELLPMTVVGVARELLLYTVELAKQKGFTVCYGDTDSCFICNGASLDKTVETVNEFIQEVNFEFLTKYGDVDHTHIKIDFEKLYSKITFPAKKRYAGYVVWEGDWLPEPYLDITGFEYVRSDTPKFTKYIQKMTIEMLLNGESRSAIIKKVYEEWEKFIQIAKPIDFAFKERITKPLDQYKVQSEHIKAAKNAMRHFNMTFSVGDAVYYVYVKGMPRVVAVNRRMDKLPWKIDLDKHFERMVVNPLEPLIGDVRKGRQRGLASYA